MHPFFVNDTMTTACAAEGTSCTFMNTALLLDAITLASIFVALICLILLGLILLHYQRGRFVFQRITS